jgi:uridine kinase
MATGRHIANRSFRNIDVVIIEGFYLGATGPDLDDYAPISAHVDFRVHLDAPVESLRRWRLGREAEVRRASGGSKGLAPEVAERFWFEALQPLADHLLPSAAATADCIVGCSEDRSVEFKRLHMQHSFRRARP